MPSRYLNQWWFLVDWTQRNTLQWNLNQNAKLFYQETAPENVVSKIVGFFRLQYVRENVSGWLTIVLVLPKRDLYLRHQYIYTWLIPKFLQYVCILRVLWIRRYHCVYLVLSGGHSILNILIIIKIWWKIFSGMGPWVIVDRYQMHIE